jgi:Nuclease-related domain
MLIKSADDKSKRLVLFEELQNSDRLDQKQKEWLRVELSKLRKGIQGERDAAFYIEAHYRDSENYAIIHDLRLVVNGNVAQIDHLLLNRLGHFYLLETKNYNANINITDHGEFSVNYGNEAPYGIQSPIEQSKRHGKVLTTLLDQLKIYPRLGSERQLHHVVLIDPKGMIKRPKISLFDSSMVIKSDQFKSWHEKHINKVLNPISFIPLFIQFKMKSSIVELAELLVRHHQPIDQLSLPEWLKPSAEPIIIQQEKQLKPVIKETVKPNYFCAKCKISIPLIVYNFSMNNKTRFAGRAYCYEHQKEFK